MIILLTVLFGCIIGLSLGLTGGGGSIFAIPLLIYGLGLAVTDAVPISLAAVGLTAAVGAWYSYRAGLLLWQPVAMFAFGGIAGAPLGIFLGRDIRPVYLIAGFSILTLTIGSLMLRKSYTRPAETRAVRALSFLDDKDPVCKLAADGRLTFTTPCAAILAAGGLLTGFLSGLFGVGGGFLIVPVLMLVIELGIHRAVAASLAVIAIIGLSGSASAFWAGDLQLKILVPFVCGGIAGMLAGRLIASRIAGPLLQRIFASGILLVGAGMLLHTLITQGPGLDFDLKMPGIFQSNPQIIGWTLIFSVVTFFGTLLIVPYLITRIPDDYFIHQKRKRPAFSEQHLLIRSVLLVLKNIVGYTLILLGITLLLLPGQGILTISIGLILIDFPGKYRLERWLVSRRRVFRSINWLRKRAGQNPIKVGSKK